MVIPVLTDSGWRNIVRRTPEGCVLSLTGEGGSQSTIPDWSGQGNNGAIAGATWVKLPSGLRVLSFDGVDDQINCGDAAVFNITAALTLMSWIYMDGDGTDDDENIISKMAGPGNGAYWFFVRQSTAKLGFSYYDTTYRDHWSTANISTGTWVHVAATYDSTNVLLYINGALDSTQAKLGTGVVTSTAQVIIGGWNLTATQDWKGKIALPRIMNVALPGSYCASVFNDERSLFKV